MSIIIASTCYSKPLLLNDESASQQPRTYAFIASRNNRGPIQPSIRDSHHSASRFITSSWLAANVERQSSNDAILHAQQLLGRRSPPLTSARNGTSSLQLSEVIRLITEGNIRDILTSRVSSRSATTQPLSNPATQLVSYEPSFPGR